MISFKKKNEEKNYPSERLAQATSEAIDLVYATIQFTPDGFINSANQRFLDTMGYRLDEIVNQHHRIFVDAEERDSLEYRRFWEELSRGIPQTREFKRVSKSGHILWMNASYMPLRDASGQVTGIIKLAQDCTAARIRYVDTLGQVQAISKSQAVIEFNLDGTIIQANDNFLNTLGYSLSEIKGKHHSMFVDDATRTSAAYRLFWEKLNRGDYDSGQYCRRAKDGREIWIQASYNPIFDYSGKPFKIVKYATDITRMIELIKELTEAANLLTISASELSSAATDMSRNSIRTNEEAEAAAVTSERVAKGVEEVATNTEEMQASIKEIARNANEASNMSSETKRQAISTNETIQKLGESSQEIGNVIKVISSIAQQTNLLALNATIEAARAGDAGRGFAVVANEVKELAKQTAKATEEITTKVGAIQADSSDAVKAISSIGQSIEKLNAIAGAIAASVEEQSATTTEVARVVRESNSGVQGITDNVRSVSQAATMTSEGSKQLMSSAQGLQDISVRLQRMVKSLRS